MKDIKCSNCWKETKRWPNEEDTLCFKCAFMNK